MGDDEVSRARIAFALALTTADGFRVDLDFAGTENPTTEDKGRPFRLNLSAGAADDDDDDDPAVSADGLRREAHNFFLSCRWRCSWGDAGTATEAAAGTTGLGVQGAEAEASEGC